jgi:methylated-DNA-protein-cysteine methyltransferase-like protein
MPSELYQRIYEISKKIPKGKVVTYGQLARLAGKPGAARAVGWALSNLPVDSGVPWHRVINRSGRSSLPAPGRRRLQQALLEAEGVLFDDHGQLDLDKFRWHGA